MRKPLIIANWKMNTTLADATILATSVKNTVGDLDIDVVLCPPYVWLCPLSELLEKAPKNIELGAQNMWHTDEGPITGEISPKMVKSLAKYVILGHSERRNLLDEDNGLINKKVHAALKHNLAPILCIGEAEKISHEKLSHEKLDFIDELSRCLDGVNTEDAEKFVICYEPIWAISRGTEDSKNPADGAYANLAIERIRGYLTSKYHQNTAERIKIIYGGSVDEDNIREFLYQPEIDGALVGGASLKVKHFIKICKEAAGRD